MNKKWATATLIILVLVLIGYVVIDLFVKKEKPAAEYRTAEATLFTDKWTAGRVFNPGKGQLDAVAISENGNVFLGGESFVACFDSSLNLIWERRTEMPVTALTVSENKVYAAVEGTILIYDMKGEKEEEWGPYESNSMISSLTANETYVGVADAANKIVFVLDKSGVVKSLIGRSEEPFIIPSYYFDVAFGHDNILYIANTGKRRIEKRNTDGKLLGFFGEPGTDPGAFCGCCNPSHFAIITEGFVTAEKGINRIKILDHEGRFVEFVSSVNKFIPPLPLDVASRDGRIIYGVNPADSKLYVFTRQ